MTQQASGSAGSAPSASPWVDFWRRETIYRETDWLVCARAFARSEGSVWRLQPTDRLLDVGCGPGHVAGWLRRRVRAYCGLDVSARYVEECRRKFAGVPGWEFFELPPDYLDFSILGERRFEKVLCFSVVQYYRDMGEVLRLVNEVGRHVSPGGVLFLGDLALRTRHGPLRSALASLRKSLPERLFWTQLTFLCRAFWSPFRGAARTQGFLEFTAEGIRSVQETLSSKGIGVEVLDLPLSLKENRFHLLLRYP